MMEAHRDVFMDCNVQGSRYYNSQIFRISGVTPTTKHCKLISAYSNVFCSRSEIKNGIFYSVLQYIGPAAGAAKYKYRVEFGNENHGGDLAVTLLARSLNEDLNEIHNSGNCVIFHPEQYNRFENDWIGLTFLLYIWSTSKEPLRIS
jgi:hypothetical protein